MSKTKKTFVDLVIALIKGDDAEVKAIKIQKKAIATLKAQIAVKKAHTLNLEEKVEGAQEVLSMARINSGKVITDGEEYISNLLRANKGLKFAEEAMQNHLGIISFLECELKEIS